MHKGCIIILPKFFMVKKLRGRECHKYPSQNCCLIVTKNFVGEHICVSDNFLYGKNMKNRYLSGFCVQVFQSHDSAEKNNGYDGGREGVSQFSVGKLLCHSAEGLRWETFCIAENLSIEKQTCA